MSLFYNFNIDSTEDILKLLAENLQKRRLEKGLSRSALSEISGVPSATIAKFEQRHTIALSSYVALAKALGYTREVKALLSQPLYSTMEELDRINKNKERKRGSRHEARK
ncbi:MAG: helix-turn-helix domain-containing protein [Mediterranea sp.]|jgi:transcriptional regulator with XRE-family HTH domain|nr:helix-turn-helix domain-containing protein [Mediterranea sp.]